MLQMDPISPSDQRSLARVAIGFGLVLLFGGIVGVYLQGPFYGGYWMFIINSDLALSFVLPTAVTVAGCLLLAPVILCSPQTSGWTARRRTLTYIAFFVGVIIAVTIAGRIGAAGVDKISY